MKIDFNSVMRGLEDKAKILYVDNERLKELLDSALRMIEENKQLKGIVDDIIVMVQLVKDSIKGDYKKLSKNNVILIIIGLLYLVIPLDLIPDFLPMGLIDDMVVIAYIINKLSNEINKYKEWKGMAIVDDDLFQDNKVDRGKKIQDLDNDGYIEL